MSSTFAERLTELMEEKEMTTAQLSKLTGSGVTTIRRWTKGQSMPYLERLIVLADLFGCTVDYLIGYSEY